MPGPGMEYPMNLKPKTATAPDHDTALAHLNDPAPTTTESATESEEHESRERIDDRTVLAKINRPAKVEERSDKGS